jgi:hypothetical protein
VEIPTSTPGDRDEGADSSSAREALELRSPLYHMQARAMLFLALFEGDDFVAQVGELSQFVLDFLQPFLSLTVSDLGLNLVAALISRSSILGMQFHKVCDLAAETRNLFAKHFDVIHKDK